MAYPTMGIDNDIVYMSSKACRMDNFEVVIAVDVRKKTPQGVAKLDIRKDFSLLAE